MSAKPLFVSGSLVLYFLCRRILPILYSDFFVPTHVLSTYLFIMDLSTEIVFDCPAEKVEDATVQGEGFETLKWRMDASRAQIPLVMPRAGANVSTFVEPK